MFFISNLLRSVRTFAVRTFARDCYIILRPLYLSFPFPPSSLSFFGPVLIRKILKIENSLSTYTI